MKVKGLLFAASFFMITVVSFGQAAEVNPTREDVLDKRKVILAKNKKNELPVLNTTDGYMGKKLEILKRLSVSEIPADFPKYKEGTSAGEYKKQMKAWGKLNQNLVKQEYSKR
jgi:hypothetical protein